MRAGCCQPQVVLAPKRASICGSHAPVANDGPCRAAASCCHNPTRTHRTTYRLWLPSSALLCAALRCSAHRETQRPTPPRRSRRGGPRCSCILTHSTCVRRQRRTSFPACRALVARLAQSPMWDGSTPTGGYVTPCRAENRERRLTRGPSCSLLQPSSPAAQQPSMPARERAPRRRTTRSCLPVDTVASHAGL